MEINSAQDYHDIISELYEGYYKANKDDRPSVEERNKASEDLIEHYFERYGEQPPSSVLSRLSTYILLDTLSDPHPDKMSRDEYPIMSYGQTGRYFARNSRLSDEPYAQEDIAGKTKELDGKGSVISNALLRPETIEHQARDWRLFLREVLTEREADIVDMMYGEGATQKEIAEELGISTRWVREIHTRVLDKIREIIEENEKIDAMSSAF